MGEQYQLQFERKVKIVGLTESQRNKELEKYVSRLSKNGWIMKDSESVAMFGLIVTFVKNSKPSVLEQVVWSINENSAAIFFTFVGVGIIITLFQANPFVGLFLLFLILAWPLNKYWKNGGLTTRSIIFVLIVSSLVLTFIKHNQLKTNESIAQGIKDNEELSNKVKKQEDAKLVAQYLLPALRESGFGISLVTDIRVDEHSMIVIEVSNVWLALPKYEQKQRRQIIEDLLTRISKPNGWNYYLVDFMGNHV